MHINSLQLLKRCFPYNLQPSRLPYLWPSDVNLGFEDPFLMKTFPSSDQRRNLKNCHNPLGEKKGSIKEVSQGNEYFALRPPPAE